MQSNGRANQRRDINYKHHIIVFNKEGFNYLIVIQIWQ